tara:strand:+ start:5689 stop:5883 length:195 start_codon:yes stop_codon:yes gene_type:complete
MIDILLVVSMLLLVFTMFMLIFVLQDLGGKLDHAEEQVEYWRQKAMVQNYEEINSRMKSGLWQD